MNRLRKYLLAGLSIGLTVLAIALPAVAQANSDAVRSRAYPWHSDRLVLDIPADVQFHPGTHWRLIITAPAHTLNHIRVRHDRITATPHGCFSLIPLCIGFGTDLTGKVTVQLTGPALRHVTIEGASTVHLGALRQNRLALKIDGSASIYGDGAVQDLRVKINGAGNIHLAHLVEQRAQVVINGSGNVAIAPTDRVTVDIRGAGKVRLHSNPPHVSSHVEGVGEVVRVPAS